MPAFQKYRAIIAHCDPMEQHRLSRLLTDTKLFQVIFTTHSGEVCVEQVLRDQPDLVIADTLLVGFDGLEVLRRIKERCSRAKVLLLTNYDILMRSRTVMELADYCIAAPYADSVLVARSIELAREERKGFPFHLVSERTAATLAVLGAPRRLKGYPYVSSGIQLTVYDPNVLLCHTGPNGLYPQLCRRYNETYRNVERCMRSVSDYIFKNTHLSVLEEYFPATVLAHGRITNFALISTLSARITDELHTYKGQTALWN